MRSLTDSPFISQHADSITSLASKINEAKVVQIITPADIEGVLAMIQLESAFLDLGINYRRKILPQLRHVGGDDDYEMPELEGFIIRISPNSDAITKLVIESEYVEISPLTTEFSISSSTKKHIGAVDCVLFCSAIASTLSPEGSRVRKVRPLTVTGSWLRQGSEVNYDPVYSFLRDHLDDEGSIDVRPITEVENIENGMVPNLSERMLKKLTKSWPEMNFEERSSALSELVLPVLRTDTISTMRLEELIWHRIVIPGCPTDIASQLKIAQDNWPMKDEEARLYASQVADKLLTNGYF